MGKVVGYYFSTKSPWSYLGHQRFIDIAEARDAAINVKPVDLGRVFSVSGGIPLKKRAPQRQAYRRVELERFRDHLGIRLTVEPKNFPGPGHEAPKLVVAANLRFGTRAAMELALGLMRGCWAEERDVDDEATRAAIVESQGLDPSALSAGSIADDVDKIYQANTDEAIEQGMFGAP